MSSASQSTTIERGLFFQLNLGLIVTSTALVVYISNCWHSVKMLRKQPQLVYMLCLLQAIVGLAASITNVIHYFVFDINCSAQAYLNLSGAQVVTTCVQMILLLRLYKQWSVGPTVLIFGCILTVGKYIPWAFALAKYPTPTATKIGICASINLPFIFYLVIAFEAVISLYLAGAFAFAMNRYAKQEACSFFESMQREGAGYFLVMAALSVVILLISLVDVGSESRVFTEVPYDVFWIFASKMLIEGLLSGYEAAMHEGTRGGDESGTHPTNFSTSGPRSQPGITVDKTYHFEDDKTRLSDTYHGDIQLNSMA
ncbi:hypothetical protein BDF22DRAFT_492300 [Syncephalis plumigaleata]|nr:hypothetical protein BDF22DRAFT_492300 [Syncephalis plumigaleata]